MKKLRPWLFALSMQALAFGAVAQEAYVGGSAGRSSWAYDCGPTGCQRNATAWRVAAGYRFNRVVALEAFYVDFGHAQNSYYAVNGRLSATGLGLQTLLGWRFGDFDLAGKIGLAAMRNEFRAAPTSSYSSTSRHRTELVGGLMSAYHVTPRLAVRMDVDVLTVALDGDAIYYSRGSDVTTVLLGVVFRF